MQADVLDATVTDGDSRSKMPIDPEDTPAPSVARRAGFGFDRELDDQLLLERGLR